jgi:4-carboxymuconolactone decarboxylase
MRQDAATAQSRSTEGSMDDQEHYKAGMAVRRAVLGDAWVDRATARTRPYSKEFQDLIVRYGWGEIWTRPGLSHHSRRILVIGTMLALGRWEEFRMHVRPALASGDFSLDDLKEVILQQAIYCGVPLANTAFHHVEAVLAEMAADGITVPGA